MVNKYNKQMLLNEEAIRNMRRMKEILSESSGKRLSYSQVINELIGKNLKFNSLDKDIRKYILSFSKELSKKEWVCGILLFGSVAKGTYNRYSDVDILVVADKLDLDYFDQINDIKMRLEEKRESFTKRGYHLRVSASVMEREGLLHFKPIFLDFFEYGIILYEEDDILTEFMDRMRKIRYERVFTEKGEILKWRTG